MPELIRQSVFVAPAVAVVAERRGFFEDEGVDVETTTTTSSKAQWEDLAQARVDLAVTAVDNLFAWNAAGSDIAVVAQIETTTQLVLALRPGLASLADTEVVRLGVDAPGNGFAIVAYAMLARAGRSAGDIEIVEAGGVRERYAALREGSVDATLLGPPLDEIGVEHGMTVAMRVADLTTGYPGLGVVMSRSRLDAGVGPVARYLRALDRANRWLAEAPHEEVVAELKAAGHGPGAIAACLAAVPDTLAPSTAGLEVLAELRREQDRMIPGAPAAGDLVDPRPLAAAGLA